MSDLDCYLNFYSIVLCIFSIKKEKVIFIVILFFRVAYKLATCTHGLGDFSLQQLTKSAEKDPVRNRAPHFLCGSLSEDKSTISVNTPSVDIPVTWKKPAGEGEKSMRGLMMESNSNSSKASKDKKGKTSNNNLTLVPFFAATHCLYFQLIVPFL